MNEMNEKILGVQVILEHNKNFPQLPGVYRMIDEKGQVIYVGKAKNIKKRVANYTKFNDLSLRIQRMVMQISDMGIIVCKTEAEALLLEAELIKKFKPKYNILLKDDKSYPYIFISSEETFPQIQKYRGKHIKKSDYFGPFAGAGAVNETLDILQRVFLLRTCKNTVFNNRTSPCLLYQIKRCCAPCCNKISKEDYQILINQAKNFFKGKMADIKKNLQKEMKKASLRLDYEKAAVFRDRIKAIDIVQQKQEVVFANIIDADAFAVKKENDVFAVKIFRIRGGQNYGDTSFFINDKNDLSENDFLSYFLPQYYLENIPPKNIFLPFDVPEKLLIEQALFQKYKQKAKVFVPKAGAPKKLIDLAVLNAAQSLSIKIAQKIKNQEYFNELKDIFNLEKVPQNIEVYDNSHLQGTNAVGALIAVNEQGFNKANYRKFNIKNQEITKNDYLMMKEVLNRRFDAKNKENFPDLIILDGGKPQLKAAREVFADFDIKNVEVLAMAKGEFRNKGDETFYNLNGNAFKIQEKAKILFFLQNIRDEAHRFVITFHRQKKAKI